MAKTLIVDSKIMQIQRSNNVHHIGPALLLGGFLDVTVERLLYR